MATSGIDETWRALVQIHSHAKSLHLLAEELEPESFKTYLQPLLEFRSALDHIVRAKANEHGLNDSTPDPKYVHDSMDKALGHIYRAFFDTADWMSDVLRERILTHLDPYPRECIVDVIPNYFPELMSRIDNISINVSTIRQGKDISKLPVLQEVENYIAQINDLVQIHTSIVSKINVMEDWMRRDKRSGRKKWFWQIAGALIASAITALICNFRIIIHWISSLRSN